MSLYSNLFYAAEVLEICAEHRFIAFMLQAEAALAKAQAQHGLIPQAAAEVIKNCCHAGQIDLAGLKDDIPLTGNPAAPLVKQLSRLVKAREAEAAKYVHLGATSQDIVDTAIVLQIREFIAWLEERLGILEERLIQTTRKHRSTIMVGRTLMQQAGLITFGLKTAGWYKSLDRTIQRLSAARRRILSVQLGGATGSRNDYITSEVRQTFAEMLGLYDAHSWHSHRDNFSEFAGVLSIMTGSLGKIAGDMVLLSQTEVAEVSEPAVEGRGTSSTMPHKRNPVLSAAIIANARRMPNLAATLLSTMMQEHERSPGLWHAEWEVMTEMIALAGGAVVKTIELIGGLEVNKKRMLQNAELTKGLIYAEKAALALASRIGRAEAQAWVEEACRKAVAESRHLKEVLTDMKTDLSAEQTDAIFKPENSIRSSLEIVDDILKKYENQL